MEANWITADRAQAWCRVLALMTVAALSIWISSSHDGIDRMGKPLGTDFVSFWTASRFALAGDPELAYDPVSHRASQLLLFPKMSKDAGYAAFFYPPTFLFLCLPLGLLPYLAALGLWLAAGIATFVASLRKLVPHNWPIVPILAFPGVLQNIGHGQNGLLSASLMACAVAMGERRPFISGLWLGALTCKPQLVLGVPFALIIARRWATLYGALVSAIGLLTCSWLAFGHKAWDRFFLIVPIARETLERGLVDPSKMQSMFAALRVLHQSVAVSSSLQILTSCIVLLVIARACFRRPGAKAELCIAIIASMLMTPFLLDYDLICLAVPIAWISCEAQKTGWMPFEKVVLCGAYFLPLVSRLLANQFCLPTGPVILLFLLLITLNRVKATAFALPRGNSLRQRYDPQQSGNEVGTLSRN